ncbi:hypothetical protein QBC35DRAFT_232587 [Podospora australis]|uniref:Uncharacterized protein n=1 Tax=Podospora australis TaxID=1536484 RepID=A0AAN7AI43_9PEZI|nr:hypothetical protein QBC35DRAFT_232587 [Podospora australis]
MKLTLLITSITALVGSVSAESAFKEYASNNLEVKGSQTRVPLAGDESVVFWSKPDFRGTRYVATSHDTYDGACYNVPDRVEMQSVEISPAHKCCLLYKAPCPSRPRTGTHFTQKRGLMNMRVWHGGVPDLCTFHFENQVQSIVCPAEIVCTGLQNSLTEIRDPTSNQTIQLTPFWTDIRMVLGHMNKI